MNIALPLPLRGLSLSRAYSDQPSNTAREFENMRTVDPRTGRIRPSTRPGLRKYMSSNAAPLFADNVKVADLISVVYDNRRIDYADVTPVGSTVAWEKGGNWRRLPPSKALVFDFDFDRQSNIYALDGNAGVVKYNKNGVQQWKLALPVKDDSHIVRAIHVATIPTAEGEGDAVFAGVSAGNKPELARMFCYLQLADNKTEKLWEVTPGGFVEQMQVRDGKLYTIQNFPATAEAKVVVYDGISLNQPSIAWEKIVGYPVNGLAVHPKDGTIFVCCEANAKRGINPQFPDFTAATEDWTPLDLVDKDKRIWAWFKATDLVDLADSDPVVYWPDQSGSDRHLIAGGGNVLNAPTYNAKGVRGMPSVRFKNRDPITGNIVTTNEQWLESGTNDSISPSYLDQQRTLVPLARTTATASSRWAMFIVGRVSQDSSAATGVADDVVQVLLGQDNPATSASYQLLTNRSSANNSVPGTFSIGDASHYLGTTIGGQGAGGTPYHGNFGAANTTGMFILGIICDGNSNVIDAEQHALYTVNGKPVDRYVAEQMYGLTATTLGKAIFGGATLRYFTGDLVEILVLRDYVDGGVHGNPLTGALSAAGTSHYPHTLAGVAVNWGAVSANSYNDLEFEKIVGYLAHRHGIAHLLPTGAPTNTVMAGPGYGPGNYPHPFYLTMGPPRRSGPIWTGVHPAGTANESKERLLVASQEAILAKLGATRGDVQWVLTKRTAVNYGTYNPFYAAADDFGGIGYGVAVDHDTNGVYSFGPITNTTPDTEQAAVLRRVVDKGTTFSTASADGAWYKTAKTNAGAETQGMGLTVNVSNPSYHYARLGVDKYGTVYVPWYNLVDAPAGTYGVVARSDQVQYVFSVTGTNNTPQAHAVKPDPNVPDFTGSPVERAEAVVIATNQGQGTLTVTQETLYRVMQTSSSPQIGSPRTVVNLGVSGGCIKRFTTSVIASPVGIGTLAQPEFTATAPYISSFTQNGKVYYTDGNVARKYDAKTDVVSEWVCTSPGAIPQRFKLSCSWRDRAVVARTADSPANWFMSKVGDPENWDFFPAVQTQDMAVAGTFAAEVGPGKMPDIINALIPASDDLLLVGCDHTIYRITGDPTAGGSIDLVSDITGIAFGSAWCKDPEGVIYFFGSRGGVYRMSPQGGIEHLTLDTIENALTGFAFNSRYAKLVWSTQENGLRLYNMPFGAGSQSGSHFFWSQQTGAWVEDTYATAGIQPTAVFVRDGDASRDRQMLVGCYDGYVRTVDKDSLDDDGEPISWNVLVGPISPTHEEKAYRFQGLSAVLATTQQGCNFELFATETPDDLGVAIASDAGQFNAGRNLRSAGGARGRYLWARLFGAEVGASCAIEDLTVQAYPAGRF